MLTAGAGSAMSRIESENHLAADKKGRALGQITVFAFFFLFFVVVCVARLHGFQLEGIGGHHFKIRTTLWARDYFPFVDCVLFDIQISVAFWTQNHKPSLAY